MQPAFLISEGYYPHSSMVVAFLDGITLKCISLLFILSKYMRVSKTTPQMLHPIKFFFWLPALMIRQYSGLIVANFIMTPQWSGVYD